MSELVPVTEWDVLRDVTKFGRVYDAQRNGLRRWLRIDQENDGGVFVAEWTNFDASDAGNRVRAIGFDEQSAVQKLARAIRDAISMRTR